MGMRGRSAHRTPTATAIPSSRWPPAAGTAPPTSRRSARSPPKRWLTPSSAPERRLPAWPAFRPPGTSRDNGEPRVRPLMNLQLTFLLVYSALLIGIGQLVGRRVRGTSDFFVAGRSLGPGLIFSTMLAANIGAGSTVNATALGYTAGVAAWWWVGSAALGSAILAFWIGPAIRRVAAARDLRTVGDFLEYRYGTTVRGLIAALLWAGSLFILAGQLFGMGVILAVSAGIPPWQGVVIGGVVITTYFTAGGLLTSAWVNMVQLIVKLGGFAIALPLVLDRVGGFKAL